MFLDISEVWLPTGLPVISEIKVSAKMKLHYWK